MRWWAIGLLFVVGCEPARVLDCHYCVSPGVPRELVEGAFVHTIEAAEVLEGVYEPPPLPPPAPAFAFSSEPYLMWRLREGEVVVPADWVDVRPDPSFDGGCCPGWEGLAATFPQPPWNERARVRPIVQDYGGVLAQLDPTLARVEPTLTDDIVELFELDADGRGFVLRADYYVQPAGCTEASCAAVVRLTHHFRRPT